MPCRLHVCFDLTRGNFDQTAQAVQIAGDSSEEETHVARVLYARMQGLRTPAST